MSYERMKALLHLAEQQGVIIVTVKDFEEFVCLQNYSR